MTELRQDSNRNESFTDHDYKYHRLNNVSVASSSLDHTDNTVVNFDDQQLPEPNSESARNSFICKYKNSIHISLPKLFFYFLKIDVNKNGFATENCLLPTNNGVFKQSAKHEPSTEPIICKDFLGNYQLFSFYFIYLLCLRT